MHRSRETWRSLHCTTVTCAGGEMEDTKGNALSRVHGERVVALCVVRAIGTNNRGGTTAGVSAGPAAHAGNQSAGPGRWFGHFGVSAGGASPGGFPDQYQTSRELFAGNAPDFRRVSQPQPGDLIVWPGHAGVVVNPAQRTFYSSLRSGFGVQPYDSFYWKGRGRPRFFRYVKGRCRRFRFRPSPAAQPR